MSKSSTDLLVWLTYEAISKGKSIYNMCECLVHESSTCKSLFFRELEQHIVVLKSSELQNNSSNESLHYRSVFLTMTCLDDVCETEIKSWLEID